MPTLKEQLQANKQQESEKVEQDCATEVIPAPRGEFDVERFRLIPQEQQTEWQGLEKQRHVELPTTHIVLQKA